VVRSFARSRFLSLSFSPFSLTHSLSLARADSLFSLPPYLPLSLSPSLPLSLAPSLPPPPSLPPSLSPFLPLGMALYFMRSSEAQSRADFLHDADWQFYCKHAPNGVQNQRQDETCYRYVVGPVDDNFYVRTHATRASNGVQNQRPKEICDRYAVGLYTHTYASPTHIHTQT
jgi:hypothetical protein